MWLEGEFRQLAWDSRALESSALFLNRDLADLPLSNSTVPTSVSVAHSSEEASPPVGSCSWQKPSLSFLPIEKVISLDSGA